VLQRKKDFLKFPLFYHAAFLLCLVLRVPSLRQELPPYLFCDENLYAGEAFALQQSGNPVTQIFRAGGLNIYPPIFFAQIFKLLGFDVNVYSNFIVLSRILMILLSAATVYVLFKIISLLTENSKAQKFTVLAFVFSPYVLSLSRQWYPDHYIVFFVSLFLYYLIQNSNQNFNKQNYLKLNISFALLLSIKYTSLVFLPLLWLVVFRDLFTTISRKKVLKVNMWGLAVFLTINFSIFFHPRKFLTDFLFNLTNYGQSEGIHFAGISYNFVVLFFLVFGILGFPLILSGAKLAINSKFSQILFLFSFICFFYLISMGQAVLVLNRNLMIFVPLILVFIGLGSAKLWERKKAVFSIGKFFVTLAFFVSALNVTYIFLHDFQTDSRVLAANSITKIIPSESTVGINEACSGSSPAQVAGFKTQYDPFLKEQLPYYVLNSYWPGPYQGLYSKSGILQEFDQKYIHFHLFSNTEFWKLSFTARDWDIVNGYEVIKVYKSNGPDVIVLRRLTK
jgi:hypothetical protein